ncbi:MAG: ATP-binding protein, partial [Marinagarivorans sp.]|nr:ATP-binding protein [Marinagarivorans sp.]
KSAYAVWGIDNETHAVIGTDFSPSSARHKQQELESWLLQKLAPKIDFRFFEFLSENNQAVVILEIQPASHTPVQFEGTEFIRIGSYKKKLREFPEKERELWRVFDRLPFEQQLAAENLNGDEVLKLLDYPAYFDLLGQPLPETRKAIFDALVVDQLIEKATSGLWSITNLGAILFAKQLASFRLLTRKAVRLILYKGNDRFSTVREYEGKKGYAIGFEGLIDTLKTLLPSNEEIGKAFRREVPMYPELALRELVANTIIHQDFNITGAGVMIEVFASRIEITNPGAPLIAIERFLDSPPRSRNEGLASFMRRIGFCEERGSGIDKVVMETEIYQLPAPLFEHIGDSTRTVLFAHREFKNMDKEEKIRACYLHSVLKYLNRQPMNNTTLRDRFGVEQKNSAMISRIIKQALEAKVIRVYDDAAGNKAMRYVPYWV